LTGLAAALVVAGCGVPPSGVIEAGDPATGMTPGVNLYFLGHNGSLVAVPRQVPVGAGVATAVRLVFAGPVGIEGKEVTTELPQLKIPPAVTVENDGTFLVQLFEQVAPFSKRATEQLTCTVVAAPFPDPVPTEVPSSVPTATPPPTAPSARRELAARHLRVLVEGPDLQLISKGAPCPVA
jgi:hypothetical protein